MRLLGAIFCVVIFVLAAIAAAILLGLALTPQDSGAGPSYEVGPGLVAGVVAIAALSCAGAILRGGRHRR